MAHHSVNIVEIYTPTVGAVTRSITANISGVSVSSDIRLKRTISLQASIVGESVTPALVPNVGFVLHVAANISNQSLTSEIKFQTTRLLGANIVGESLANSIFGSLVLISGYNPSFLGTRKKRTAILLDSKVSTSATGSKSLSRTGVRTITKEHSWDRYQITQRTN